MAHALLCLGARVWGWSVPPSLSSGGRDGALLSPRTTSQLPAWPVPIDASGGKKEEAMLTRTKFKCLKPRATQRPFFTKERIVPFKQVADGLYQQ